MFLIKFASRNMRSLCYFVGSKLIHPANPLMYEPNPARSPLIALSCLVDRYHVSKYNRYNFIIRAIMNKQKREVTGTHVVSVCKTSGPTWLECFIWPSEHMRLVWCMFFCWREIYWNIFDDAIIIRCGNSGFFCGSVLFTILSIDDEASRGAGARACDWSIDCVLFPVQENWNI